MHSAQTKNDSCLTYDTDCVVKIQSNDILIVNVRKTRDELVRYFNRYRNELIDPDNEDLRTNFIKKMDDITKKWDGCAEID